MHYKKVKILCNHEISEGIFKLVLDNRCEAVDGITPGQFFMVRAWGLEPLLSRPISVSTANEKEVTFLYAALGKGTQLLSKMKPGDEAEILGPLGNGFDVHNIKGKIAIIAGGIGIAPMVQLVKELNTCSIDVYAGFRNNTYALELVKPYVREIKVSTENGSEGYKGYITDIVNVQEYDMILCCGPEVMMNKVVKECRKFNIPLLISMEKHMACGVGACLVCTCKTNSGNKRTCKDGPVFSGDEMEL
jgi:dihydroorotate dehydrogenase electron transfer subunit